MKITILNDITNYIDFLRQCGQSVTLSCFENRFEPYTTDLMKYEVHILPICRYLKLNASTVGRCGRNKRKLEKLDIKEAYYSCCYAGIEEYVIPVIYKDIFLMNIHLSGYRNTIEKSKENMNRIAKICGPEFKEMYKALSTNAPSLFEATRFIKPLEYMIIKLYKYCRDNYENAENLSVTKALYLRVMSYIHENYMHEISCSEIAKELGYSSSYLRYVFKKESDGSLNSKINDVRLSHATYLLANTKLNITEISFNCGFYDSNYFSSVFKKKYGISPRTYREKYIKGEFGVYPENNF